MNQCKRDGCGSYAINDHKESGLCDKCYWIEQAEKLTTERDKLKSLLEQSYWHVLTEDISLATQISEALKESA